MKPHSAWDCDSCASKSVVGSAVLQAMPSCAPSPALSSEPFRSEDGLDVHLLGSISVYRGAQRLCSQLPPKALALFIMIIAEAPQRFRREQLAGLLWPHLEPEAARNNLRRLLHILRSVIEDRSGIPVILADRGTVQFNGDAPVWCDLRNLMDARVPNCRCTANLAHGCIAGQESLLGLYKGELFGGQFHWVCDEFGAWEAALRESARRRAKILCMQLLKCLIALGDEARLVRYAERYVGLDPDEEFGYQQLSQIYTSLNWSGAAGEALDRYRKRSMAMGFYE